MKITVRNTDGRLGTGVSAIEYATQKDGAVSRTVRAAPVPAKKTLSQPSADSSLTKGAGTAAAAQAEGLPSARPSAASLENQLRQAQVDLDTDAIIRLNKQLKEERARQGKQTLGDRVSDVASAAFGGAGGSFANLAGFVGNLFQDPETDRRQIAWAQEALRTGRTDDGKPISEAQRKTLQEAVSRLEASAQKKESPDSVVNQVYRAADRMADTGAAYHESAKEGLGKVGSTIVDAGVSMGQSALDAALGMATGTGMAPFVARSLGGGTQEARRSGADLSEQLVYGSAQAAKEYVTEKLFGLSAPQRLLGGGSFDDAIEAGIRKATERLAKTPAGQKVVGGLMTWLAGGATEALEEGIGAVIENAVINPNLRDWDPDTRTVEEKISDGLYDMLVGGVSGLMGVTNLAQYQVGKTLSQPSADSSLTKGAKETAQAAVQGPNTPAPESAVKAAQTAPRDVVMEAAARGGRLEPEVDMRKELERFQLKGTEQKAAPETGAAAVNQNGLTALSQLERENLSSGKRNKIVSTFDEAVSFVQNALRNRQSTDRAYLGKIPDSVARMVREQTGVDISGFGAMFNGVDIRHIINNHGDPFMETARGQVQVTPEDIAHIPEIIASPDRVYLSKELDGKGRQAIVFEKTIGDKLITMQGVSNGKKLLQTDTLYIKKGTPQDTVIDTGASASPEHNVRNVLPQGFSKPTIQQSAPEVKGDMMTGNDGLGAADAGTVNSGFQNMQSQTDRFHSVNPEAESRTIEERGRASADVPVENPETGDNIRKTVSTILNSPLTSNEMAPILEQAISERDKDGAFRFDYKVMTDRDALTGAEEQIRKNGYRDSVNSALFSLEMGRGGKEAVVLAEAVYNEAVSAGEQAMKEGAQEKAAAYYADALDLASALASAGTDYAQGLQALHMLNRMTPAGKLVTLRRVMERMGRNQSQQRKTSLNALNAEGQRADFVEKRTGFTISDELAADYLAAETEEARAEAWEAIIQDLADQVPNTLLEKWDAWRYLSMLTNPTTHIRNTGGNVVFGQLQRRVKNLIGTGLERAVLRDSSQRTKSILTRADRPLKDFASKQYEMDQSAAMGQGKYQEGSARSIEREIQEHRKILPKPLQWISDKNSAALDAEDVFFNRPVYVDSFAQALKAKGVTAEEAASGQKAELVDAARVYAVREAQKATFRDSNAFSDFVSKLGRTGDQTNQFTRAASGAVDILMPFRKTPANVLAQGMEYSPAGLGKAITYDAYQVRNGNMTAAEMLDHLSSGITGTGIFALGAYLAAQGWLKIRPGDDDRERNFLKDSGFQDFSLQIGKHSYTLSWLSPSAMPLFAGAAMIEAAGSENTGSLEAFLNAMSGVTDTVLETSMLSSIDELLNGIGYAENKVWYLVSQTVMDLISQGVPTVLGKIASAADDTVRSSYVPGGKTELGEDLSFFLQELQRKVPVARNAMQPKIDLWGRDVSNGGAVERFLESFLSPGYYSRTSEDTLTKELHRLANATGNSGVYPQKAGKSFKLNDGTTKYLTAEEYTAYARMVGQTRLELLGRLMNQPGYQTLSDDQKAKAISSVYEYAGEKGKLEIGGWKPTDSHIFSRVAKSLLPVETYILYQMNSDRDGNGNVTARESAETLMELPDLSDAQRGDAWCAMNKQTSPFKNPFTGTLAKEGMTPEESMTAWGIYGGKGTKEEPYTQRQKKQDMQKELELTAAEVNRLWILMENAAEEK